MKMAEPQVIINKTWGEHQQGERIKRLEKDRTFKIIFTMFFVFVILFFLTFFVFAGTNLSPSNSFIVVIVVLIAIFLIWKFRRKIFGGKVKAHYGKRRGSRYQSHGKKRHSRRRHRRK